MEAFQWDVYMCTARLPTVRVAVAATSCQYRGFYPRSHAWGVRGRYTQSTPPPEGTRDQAYPPPPCEQTHAYENITFPQLL